MIDKLSGYSADNNMRELIRDNNMLLAAISRFNIAFGFGDAPVEQVCRENGVDTSTFLAVCNLLSGYPFRALDVSAHSLILYLKRAHTSFLDVTLPKIRMHLIEAINHSETNDVALLLIKFFDDYVEEVKRHMERENEQVFSYVERLLRGEVEEGFRIADFSINHGHMATKLNELKDIFIYHYDERDNARLSAVLFDIMVCERDLMSHFEVENKLFVPLVEHIERHNLSECGDAVSERSRGDEVSPDIHGLSRREIDVIRCVAQGKSNKEIADELFISAHTVATHRRNLSAKLDIHSSAGLAIFAIIHGIVDLNEVKPQ